MSVQVSIEGELNITYSASILVDNYPEHRNYEDLMDVIVKDKLLFLKFVSERNPTYSPTDLSPPSRKE